MKKNTVKKGEPPAGRLCRPSQPYQRNWFILPTWNSQREFPRKKKILLLNVIPISLNYCPCQKSFQLISTAAADACNEFCNFYSNLVLKMGHSRPLFLYFVVFSTKC